MSFEIAGRRIAPDAPMYVIAELSANHLGDLGRARAIVEAAAAAGADAVKLQTYTPERMTMAVDDDRFRVGAGSLWERRHLFDLYEEAMTPWEWHAELIELADALGMACFSSPFDRDAVNFLVSLGVPALKLASFELVDLPLIEAMAATGLPLVMSTGMGTVAEIEEAIETAVRAGASRDAIALLRCTSAYPAPPDAMDLRTIPDMAARFGVTVGLSDHTLGATVPIVGRTLGATILEKHLTLRRADGGPDGAFSMEPEEFAAMVREIRTAEAALGGVRYGAGEAESGNLAFRRSLFVVRSVRQGERLSENDVRSLRPGSGLHPRHLHEVVGRTVTADVEAGTPLSWALLA